MTWAWSIPISIEPRRLLCSPGIDPRRMRAVIPTFRDWEDARVTVESLLDCRPRPREIVLVNDNPELDTPAWVARAPIYFSNYLGNRGPAFARNVGAFLETGSPIDWLYFTDTGCTRDRNFFAALSETRMRLLPTTVAIGGPVVGVIASPKATPINFYMTEEEILSPPVDRDGPQSIVTANAAVSAAAFRATGGFDVSFPFAAGEDLDLGLRLRQLGRIGWSRQAVVRHRFVESLDDFRSRFTRYGAGNAHLERRWGLPSLRVRRIVARDVELQRLADVQLAAMQDGYDRHWQTAK